jgi:predicted kinase
MGVNATLFIFAGLLGTGRTTLSQRLVQRIKAMHLRIDTIEQGLRDLCDVLVEGQGYRLAYRIAADNLSLGMNVVAVTPSRFQYQCL